MAYAPANGLHVAGIGGLPEIDAGADLAALIVDAAAAGGAPLLDGDIVVVESRPVADNGQTVVAVIDGEATVKRFHRERGGRIRLQPANDRYPPMILGEQDVEIRGVVVGLLRTLIRH